MANTQVIQKPTMYVNGLLTSFVSTTEVAIASGAARDLTNVADIELDGSGVVIDTTVIGANGLDDGLLTASSWYRVFVIGDSTLEEPGVGIISLNDVPTLPDGYDVYRRVGWIRLNGASQILQFSHLGAGDSRTFVWEDGVSVLSSGAAVAFTPVNISAGMPPLLLGSVVFNVGYGSNGAGTEAVLRPLGSLAVPATLPKISGPVAGQTAFSQLRVNAVENQIEYIVTNGADSLDLHLYSYDDYLDTFNV